RRRSIAGSLIGGIQETQEMLDFCGEHNILADIELIGMQQINDAYDRMLRSDVKYRFVIDLASLKRSHDRSAAVGTTAPVPPSSQSPQAGTATTAPGPVPRPGSGRPVRRVRSRTG